VKAWKQYEFWYITLSWLGVLKHVWYTGHVLWWALGHHVQVLASQRLFGLSPKLPMTIMSSCYHIPTLGNLGSFYPRPHAIVSGTPAAILSWCLSSLGPFHFVISPYSTMSWNPNNFVLALKGLKLLFISIRTPCLRPYWSKGGSQGTCSWAWATLMVYFCHVALSHPHVWQILPKNYGCICV
jgi:hypothetical protein